MAPDIDERIARCVGHLCQWEVEFPTVPAARRAEEAHTARKHPEFSPAPGWRPGSGGSGAEQAVWETVALDAVRALAATGREFVIFDVHEFGVGEPPDISHDWGRLTAKARQMGLIEKVLYDDGTAKAVESKRPETRGSLVKVWRGTAQLRAQGTPPSQGELSA